MNGKDIATGLVTYDLPVGCVAKNPSGLLRSAGLVRLNYSTWIGPLWAVERLPVEKWRNEGMKVEAVQFADHDYENVRRLARLALETSMRDLRESISKALESARDRFERAENEMSANLVKRARGFLRRRLNASKKAILDAREAALAFDLLVSSEDLFVALRASIHADEETMRLLYDAAITKTGGESSADDGEE